MPCVSTMMVGSHSSRNRPVFVAVHVCSCQESWGVSLRAVELLQAPSGKLDHFLPLSDFTFSSMREALLAEYSAALGQRESPAGTCQDRQCCTQTKRTIDILVTAGQRDCRCFPRFCQFLAGRTTVDCTPCSQQNPAMAIEVSLPRSA